MTTPSTRRPSKDASSYRVAPDAPIRSYRKVTLSRDEWDALRSGQTIEQVKLGRKEIMARKEGE